MSRFTLHRGDSREVLKTLAENSVDSIVTDPPYELGFMGKSWDNTGIANDVTLWREALRVLKPGGYLVAFGGTRTFHRLACAIEDAGFEMRDTGLRGHMPQAEDCPWLMAWAYGSGFPKSLDVSKAIVMGQITAPATADARQWEGWGTALKPAWEPIVMARKPLIGTVAANVLRHGTGALNIDACRIQTGEAIPVFSSSGGRKFEQSHTQPARKSQQVGTQDVGRWPANLIHDGSPEVVACFPDAPGQLAPVKYSGDERKTQGVYGAMKGGHRPGGLSASENGYPVPNGPQYIDSGSAARFFYCAKASREDRNEGCEHMASKPLLWSSGTQNPGSFQAEGTDRSSQNFHPTVKPTELMRWLVRLVTPAGGTVVDPFMGSGSTGKAAMLEGMRFIGIDRDADEHGNPLGYIDIARARIEFALRQGHQPNLLEAA